MHFSLGNTQRGIIGGWVVALCGALAVAVQSDDTDWWKVLGAVLLITGPVIGALIDPGSQPTKAEAPKE